MYQPTYRIKENHVPILSGEEISEIGERYVADFQPEVLANPQPVDVEAFLELYLGMTVDYQYLSHNGIYLGMTVFNDTDRLIIFSGETGRAEYIQAKAGTVIIDRRLLVKQQTHRLRFTIAHEGGHGVFHSGYFSAARLKRAQRDSLEEPLIQCRRDVIEKRSSVGWWTEKDWMEWQANRFASALLMPTCAVKQVASNSQGDCRRSVLARFELVRSVQRTFDVSRAAAVYRLKDLGYIPLRDRVDYINESLFQVMTISAS